METMNQMKVTAETLISHCRGTSKRLTQRKHSPCSIFLHETSHWCQFRFHQELKHVSKIEVCALRCVENRSPRHRAGRTCEVLPRDSL